jgi:hypothetical protein
METLERWFFLRPDTTEDRIANAKLTRNSVIHICFKLTHRNDCIEPISAFIVLYISQSIFKFHRYCKCAALTCQGKMVRPRIIGKYPLLLVQLDRVL